MHGRMHMQMGRRQESSRVPQCRLHNSSGEFELRDPSPRSQGQSAGRLGRQSLLISRPHQPAAHFLTQLQSATRGERCVP